MVSDSHCWHKSQDKLYFQRAMSNRRSENLEEYVRQVEMAYLRILRRDSPWLGHLRANTYLLDRVMGLIWPLVRLSPVDRTVVQDFLLRELVRRLRRLRRDREHILEEIGRHINSISISDLDDEIEHNDIIEAFVSQFESDSE